MRIGTIVRSLREQHGLTQSELAQKAGIQQSYLSRLESGTRSSRPDAVALAHIAQALGVTLDEILIQAGIWPSADRGSDLRWKRMERTFRSLPSARQEELLAIAQALLSLPSTTELEAESESTLQPRVIGSPAEGAETENQTEDQENTRTAEGGSNARS
jgi:transcriptional regulator with XRE-family HTH domain